MIFGKVRGRRRIRRVKGAKTREEFEVANSQATSQLWELAPWNVMSSLPLPSSQIHLWSSKTLTTDYPVD